MLLTNKIFHLVLLNNSLKTDAVNEWLCSNMVLLRNSLFVWCNSENIFHYRAALEVRTSKVDGTDVTWKSVSCDTNTTAKEKYLIW